MGALVAAGFAALGAGPLAEVAAFGGTAVALITVARPVLKRRLYTAHVLTNVEALIGDRAIVVSTVDARGGKIKLRGEFWSARAFDETEVLEPGHAVTVMSISGATAVVLGEPS
jgi:membrane protein implicated in regulation of membrane protease activity